MLYPIAMIDLKRWPFLVTVLVSGIASVLMSMFIPLAALGFIGLVFLLFVATRNPFLNLLVIISSFSVFPFLAILWPEVGEPRFTVLKDVLYLIVLAIGYLRYRRGSTLSLLAGRTSFLGIYLIVLFLFWIVSSPDHLIGLTSLRDHTEFVLIALIIPLIIRPGDPQRIMISLMSLTSVIALAHLVDFGVIHRFVFARGASRTLLNILNPNVLGTLYAMQLAILVSMWRFLVRKSRHRMFTRILLAILFVILAGALVISFSRRNIIALVISLLLGYWLLNSSISITRRILILVLIVFIVTILFHYAPRQVQDRFQSVTRIEDSLNVKRLSEIEIFASEFLTDIPLLLLGKGFGYVGSDNLLRGDSITYFHNYYVILLSDSGLVGLFLFLIAIGTILLRPVFFYHSDREIRPVEIALFQGILVVLIGNLFGTTLMTIPVNVFFWSLVGLMIYFTRSPRKEQRG